ncbi:hypothetical protein C8R45DRAFT_924253 [Mycena sanguinolenta]|nr:hypothetical protein C8R45DRAFT_924253 [Mycena sanguinolenta]
MAHVGTRCGQAAVVDVGAESGDCPPAPFDELRTESIIRTLWSYLQCSAHRTTFAGSGTIEQPVRLGLWLGRSSQIAFLCLQFVGWQDKFLKIRSGAFGPFPPFLRRYMQDTDNSGAVQTHNFLNSTNRVISRPNEYILEYPRNLLCEGLAEAKFVSLSNSDHVTNLARIKNPSQMLCWKERRSVDSSESGIPQYAPVFKYLIVGGMVVEKAS